MASTTFLLLIFEDKDATLSQEWDLYQIKTKKYEMKVCILSSMHFKK